MNASTQAGNGDEPEIDACAGCISPTGHRCDYLIDAVSDWMRDHWKSVQAFSPPAVSDDVKTESTILDSIRELTGHDSQWIHRALTSSSIEQALQWAIVLCRRKHGGDASKCLSAVGADHGDAVVGRMASGRAESRGDDWPIMPGFDHVEWGNLPSRINEQTAMVLIDPIDRHAMASARDADTWQRISEACDRHGALLVIDHRDVPPMGGGFFWVHDSIADVRADAVIMSAGLFGNPSTETGGALLILNDRLAKGIPDSHSSAPAGFQVHSMSASIAAASFRQWVDNDWMAVGVEPLAVDLAKRLAMFETIRDLHVTGRTIGIEMDLPAAEWIGTARQCGLRVRSAGDYAIRLQPPLVMTDDEQTELLDRIETVFRMLGASEDAEAEPAASMQADIDETVQDENNTDAEIQSP